MIVRVCATLSNDATLYTCFEENYIDYQITKRKHKDQNHEFHIIVIFVGRKIHVSIIFISYLPYVGCRVTQGIYKEQKLHVGYVEV